MIGKLRTAVAAALLLAAGNAWALGLGQIEVKSRRNQPLLAEIPIVSTTPGELEALQARLASPDTFRRVGLAPPSGAAANLQFSLGSDARGRPVIRVTTVAPVDQAVLNFLIEVDWGQGRLVREYSAMIDAPRTASAPLQPAIAAPVVAAPNVVQRPATPSPALPIPPPVQPVPVTPVPAPDPEPEPEPTEAEVAIAPLPPPPAAASPPPVAVVPAPAVAAAPTPAAAVPAQYGPVKAGETLSGIASGLGLTSGYSLDQAMLALLRANPDAFLGDNINRLKRGAVLRVPDGSDVDGINADEAGLVVREQMQQWRQARRPVAQPDTDADDGAAGANVATGAASAATPTRAASPAAAAKPAAAPRREAQARLQIVPPSAPGKATGTRSGTSAGGEGSMLQQQLRQKDEDIAAKAAEIGELKERVAELETLRQQQEQLLTMKDTELAAAQQRLADARNAAAAAPAPATAAATPPSQAAQAGTTQPAQASPPIQWVPWLWGGLALFGVALLAWLFMRRGPGAQAPARPKPKPGPRRGFDSEALAASMVAPAQAPSPSPEIDATGVPVQTEVDLADVPQTATPRAEAPNWHSGWVKADPVAPAAAASAEPPRPRFVPGTEPDMPPPPKASAEQRIKLARAFLDIGDEHSAKELLRELLDDGDPAARNDAAKMLRELD